MDDEFQIEVGIDIPSDSDGFIRRQCPHCERQFKWHDGPANEEAEQRPAPHAYNCPLCGQPAALDSWDTEAQIELAQQAAMPQIMGMVNDELASLFRGVKGLTYKPGTEQLPDESVPLTEPDDMVIIASPCHSYEPVKIPEDHTSPLYCLVCGSAFAV